VVLPEREMPGLPGLPGPRGARPLRPHLPDVRPLDRFRSLKIKLAILVVASVTLAAFITWVGLRNTLGPTRTFPLAIVISMLFTMILARGMTSPLREMTAAARSMSEGDYSRRVRATSRDEVGQLATAFNIMAEDLDSSDRVRRELIANVSHELRTPVAALQAQLENLVDGVVDPSPATMQTALTQTERLTRLITYLLDLSRIEAGAADLNITDLDAQAFLADTVGSVSTLEAGKQLSFVVDVDDAGMTFQADPERLRQILVNLLQNAIRHSPFAGEVVVSARARPGAVVIDVSDTGPGIAKADRQRPSTSTAGPSRWPTPGRGPRCASRSPSRPRPRSTRPPVTRRPPTLTSSAADSRYGGRHGSHLARCPHHRRREGRSRLRPRPDEGLRGRPCGRRPLVRRGTRSRHRVPRPERFREDDHAAHDPRPEHADGRERDDLRSPVPRPRLAAAPGGGRAGVDELSPGTDGARPPADVRTARRCLGRALCGGPRARRSGCGRGSTGRRVLARHAAAARARHDSPR